MKKLLFTLFLMMATRWAFASIVLDESFEYANHDYATPVGWTCDDESWLCGYLEKDHNRMAHTGNWYAFTNTDDSWMFMPLFIGNDLKYRFYFWAISDGEYDVELWVGNGGSSSEMTQLLFTKTVSSGEYERFFEYVENINNNCSYIGIRAIAHEGAYHLTIDDILVEMVSRYDLDVTPSVFDTTLLPGSRITLHYNVANTGFEDLLVTMTPHTEYFGDIEFTEDNFSNNTFPTVPNQVVRCTCTATLLPDVELGSRVWMDIMFTVSCDCLTRMATLWVTVGETTDIPKHKETSRVYPNPANNYLNIQSEGLQRIEVMDILGKKLIGLNTSHDEIHLDISNLPSGLYFLVLKGQSNYYTEKIVKN